MKNTSQLPDPSTSMATGSFFNAWVAGQAVRVSLDRAAQSLDKEYLQGKISNPSPYTDALGITYGLCRNFKGDVLISGGNLVVNSNTGYFVNIVIGGNRRSVNSGFNCSILGGTGNRISSSSDYSIIAGGRDNLCVGDQIFIGAGYNNSLNGDRSCVINGDSNTATGNYDYIGNGTYNIIENATTYCSILNGASNKIEINSDYAVIAGGQNNNITSSSDWAFLGGGRYNSIFGSYSTVIAGRYNYVYGSGAPTAGGSP